MEENKYVYNYSAKEQEEIEQIRKKYVSKEETKIDELKRLDEIVKKSGTKVAVVNGIVSSLVLGSGMCLAMQIIGSGPICIAIGIIVGLIGIGGAIGSYFMYKKIQNKTKDKYAARILKLADEIKNN